FPRASIPVCLTATPPAPLHPLSLHDALPIVIYYRLKIVDNDGATTFSKIVSIEYQGSLAFSISPNPATNKIIVRGNNITRVEILNQAGKTIIKKQYLSSPQIQLNISALPSGVYVVKITDRNRNIQNRRVVVQ